jgi:predicted ATPase
VAYQSLLTSTRQRYHQQLAQALAARPETAETQPELLAHHYTEAGLAEQAIPYWQRAGQRALERSANAEAVGHLTTALEPLKTLPDTLERTRQELDIQIALGPALMATKGLAAPEVEHTYGRARELCHQLGDMPQLFPVLSGLQRFYLIRAEFQTAHELAQQLLRLAARQHEPALLLEGHRASGNTLFWLGEVVPAHTHLVQGIALYDPQQHRGHAVQYGRDPGVDCRAYASWTLWMQGYPDQALRMCHEALTLAARVAHPYSLAQALAWATILHEFRRETQAVQERAAALIALCTEHGFAQWLASGTIYRGWALAAQGQVREGLAQMRQGLAAVRATGAEIGRPYQLSLLASVYGGMGEPEEGLRLLAEALALVEKSGGRWREAELYRLKGELLLARSVAYYAEAETCFRQALDVARRQQAKSLKLRAAMSLSRLWQQQGKRDEARELLAPIYSWFTEGFNTPDLQEAKALLDELA